MLTNFYKIGQYVLASALLVPASLSASTITINWGLEVLDEVVDSFDQALTSTGDTIDDGFIMQLGIFINDFVPTKANRNDWISNWRVFDQAPYDEDFGFLPGTADLLSDGSSNSAYASVGTDFSNAEAFIWVRNSNTMNHDSGDEWFLARAGSWVFPDAPDNDCNCVVDVLEFAISDIVNEISDAGTEVVWGRTEIYEGEGLVHEINESAIIQTYTIPEPSAGLALMAGALGLLWYRRRKRKEAKDEESNQA